MKNLLLLLLPVLLLFSCKKNADVSVANDVATNDAVYKYIKKLGYRDNEIKDIGKEYLVDGDLLFAKNSSPDFSVFDGPRTEQYGTANYVGYNVQPNITVRIDPSMNAYVNEINGAIAIWNNVINCRTKFTLTTATNQNILIYNYNLGANTCGAAYYPMNGQPGITVRINLNQIAGNPFLQRQRTIAHELGHCIGFRHTNWQEDPTDPMSGTSVGGARFDAMHILGTPTGNDVNSLMNGGQCGFGATALSNFDILAAQFLYPANPPVAGTVPVFRYFNRADLMNHFYTTNYNELGNGSNDGWIFEGIGFFAFFNQVNGSVPVYRYYSSSSSDHYYTTNFNELGSGKADYGYEGIRFYVYPSALNGSVAVFGYWNGNIRDHFFTKNQNEFIVSGLQGYQLERTAFFAY